MRATALLTGVVVVVATVVRAAGLFGDLWLDEIWSLSLAAAADFPVEHVPWSLARQDAAVAELDIGIMPLDENSPFTRGKCSYKLLQYMAAGVPCVASPVGMNAEVVESGENGFLASTPAEWSEAFERLASSTELRERLGRAGRRRIEASHTYPATADRWATFLRELNDRTDRPPRPRG